MLTDFAMLTGQWTPGLPVSSSPVLGLQLYFADRCVLVHKLFYMSTEVPNSGSHASKESTLPNESCFQPIFLLLFWDRLLLNSLRSQGWPWTPASTFSLLELKICAFIPSLCVLGIEPQDFFKIGKHFTSWELSCICFSPFDLKQSSVWEGASEDWIQGLSCAKYLLYHWLLL